MTATTADSANITRLLEGEISVPLPTYFALGSYPLPDQILAKLNSDEAEVCPNLSFLGRRTVMKTTDGIKIVALGGDYAPTSTVTVDKDNYRPEYTSEDVKFLKGVSGADILITNEWPKGILAGSKVAVIGPEPLQQQDIADLCSCLKPTYHFSTSPNFFEREPFFHMPDDASQGYATTRFISLASFGNENKQKWIYAFNLDTTAATPLTVPTGTTASPLVLSPSQNKRRREDTDGETFSRFANGNGHNGQHHSNKRRRGPKSGHVSTRECYFCLSSENLNTNVIVSLGEDAYMTNAKGPLTESTTFPGLGFPCHILIIPVAHEATLTRLPEADRDKTVAEMQKYRAALQDMLANHNKDKPEAEHLGAVTYEISKASGVHVHWQFLPMPAHMIKSSLVEVAFQTLAENMQYPKFEQKPFGIEEGSDYFRTILWSEDSEEKNLIMHFDHSVRFDLQFGRRVLGQLLKLDKRIHWQDCVQTSEEENADATAFKEAFKTWDFTLE
ncbi:hypothetical protein LTR66_006015 [Elasticomyces elasticus]|nr:hypothetical protein LTR66_006015 [Elasticomyces elasticus]